MELEEEKRREIRQRKRKRGGQAVENGRTRLKIRSSLEPSYVAAPTSSCPL